MSSISDNLLEFTLIAKFNFQQLFVTKLHHSPHQTIFHGLYSKYIQCNKFVLLTTKKTYFCFQNIFLTLSHLFFDPFNNFFCFTKLMCKITSYLYNNFRTTDKFFFFKKYFKIFFIFKPLNFQGRTERYKILINGFMVY